MNGHRPDGQPYMRPTPREIRVLKATEDGCPLAEAAVRLGVPRTSVAAILSAVYLRLGVALDTPHHLSRERRVRAVEVCKRNGWWPED